MIVDVSIKIERSHMVDDDFTTDFAIVPRCVRKKINNYAAQQACILLGESESTLGYVHLCVPRSILICRCNDFLKNGTLKYFTH